METCLMWPKLQLSLARKAGETTPQGRYTPHVKWVDEYQYHLAMVDNPLPFSEFRAKCNLLNNYLNQDPDGASTCINKRIERLCGILGY